MLQAVEEPSTLHLGIVRPTRTWPLQGLQPPRAIQALGASHRGTQALAGLPALAVQEGQAAVIMEEEG